MVKNISKIDITSKQSKENKINWNKEIELLNSNLKLSRFQGNNKQIDRARKRNKFLARERIELILDPDSPFFELMPLSGIQYEKGFGAGGTNVSGIGLVNGKLCAINSNVGTRKGGSVDFPTVKKSSRMNQIILENKLPTINLVESGGANLPDQAMLFNLAGENFRDITKRSKLGLVTISVVFGNATAGGAYVPGMSDFSIFQKKSANVFLAGPPLVKMATNEISTNEELGGAEMHSKISGVSDYLAEDEYDAIRIAREIMLIVKTTKPHYIPKTKIKPPKYNSEEILNIIPTNIKHPWDIRELIIRIVDNSKFSEFKENYGPSMVTGWAEIHGYPIGVLANNGVIFSESSNKATQFIQLCNQNNIPLIFLQNTTGFMVGKEYEEGGIIKNGAKLINAVTNSTVPAITLMTGNSYGAGNYGMNGRSYNPRFLFTYPHAKLAVMGSEQLAGVMEIIRKASAKSLGLEINQKKEEKIKKNLIKEVEKSASAYYSTDKIWDDGIIDPRETRNYFGFCLAIIYNQEIKGTQGYGIWRH
ncbi:MAG: carboxyl transferase domain-containing protein [Flavobacteriaceae bacterium]|nr:carboxyl transferase domain-containing protein [Flavobacteriaceae bacterium]